LIAMCSRMFHQGTAELRKRLYDLIREVVGFHVTSPRPVVASFNDGSFPVIRSPYPASLSHR
jgi:hypothetical protein